MPFAEAANTFTLLRARGRAHVVGDALVRQVADRLGVIDVDVHGGRVGGRVEREPAPRPTERNCPARAEEAPPSHRARRRWKGNG